METRSPRNRSSFVPLKLARLKKYEKNLQKGFKKWRYCGKSYSKADPARIAYIRAKADLKKSGGITVIFQLPEKITD